MKKRRTIAPVEEIDAEEIEEYIADNPLVKIGGKTYDRRTVTEIDVGKGVTEIPVSTFNCAINVSSIKLHSVTSRGKEAMRCCKSLNLFRILNYLSNLKCETG